MKKKFVYPVFYKILYRYGNILVTIILLIYLIAFLSYGGTGLSYYIYLAFVISMLLLVNRHYYILYKLLPTTIEAMEDKVVGRNYFLRNCKVEIRYDEIENLTGGIFNGRLNSLMKIYGKDGTVIGFFHKIKEAKILETILLNKIKKEVYDKVYAKMKD